MVMDDMECISQQLPSKLTYLAYPGRVLEYLSELTVIELSGVLVLKVANLI